MTHTPGPWERLPGITEAGHPDGEGKAVYRIVEKRAPGETRFRKIALVDGNNCPEDACLIAVAPKMHDVLSGLVTQFKHDGCSCTFPSDECCAYAEARALLNYLEGR